jgi:hypothetical protein
MLLTDGEKGAIIHTYTKKELEMQTNCTAYVKTQVNKKLQTVRLVIAVNNNKITVRNACFVSGDINTENELNMQADIARVLTNAHAQLRTNNFVFV